MAYGKVNKDITLSSRAHDAQYTRVECTYTHAHTHITSSRYSTHIRSRRMYQRIPDCSQHNTHIKECIHTAYTPAYDTVQALECTHTAQPTI